MPLIPLQHVVEFPDLTSFDALPARPQKPVKAARQKRIVYILPQAQAWYATPFAVVLASSAFVVTGDLILASCALDLASLLKHFSRQCPENSRGKMEAFGPIIASYTLLLQSRRRRQRKEKPR